MRDSYCCCLCGAVDDHDFGLRLVEVDDCQYFKYACPDCQQQDGVRVLTNFDARLVQARTGGLERRFACTDCGKAEAAEKVTPEQLGERGWTCELGEWLCENCNALTEWGV